MKAKRVTDFRSPEADAHYAAQQLGLTRMPGMGVYNKRGELVFHEKVIIRHHAYPDAVVWWVLQGDESLFRGVPTPRNMYAKFTIRGVLTASDRRRVLRDVNSWVLHERRKMNECSGNRPSVASARAPGGKKARREVRCR